MSRRRQLRSPSETAFLRTENAGGDSRESYLSSTSSLITTTSLNSTSARPTLSYSSVTEKFSLPADPALWGTSLTSDIPEPDDYLHSSLPRENINYRGNLFTLRGLANVGCVLVLCCGLVGLFVGYPVISFFTTTPLSTLGGFNVGGINSSGQIPSMSGSWGLIDPETPQDALTYPAFNDGGQDYELVFSDEFNTEGRSFYPGDDPYWQAEDLHYWQTGNLEWYDPSSLTTSNGSLQITLSAHPEHDLNYTGGMLNSWNKFCFTGGLVLTSVRLPGDPLVHGFWPAIWTMGNLGRAGYGASLEGMWPYTYDSCDVGTVANQSLNGQPAVALENGDPFNGGAFSYLPGQKLSRCTCPGGSHPGPVHEDGTYVGRSAPEIDIFEATVSSSTGYVSQSAQWAPFDAGYQWFNTSEFQIIPNTSITTHNSYEGGAYQMATSALSLTDQNCYERPADGSGEGCYAIYGVEYKTGFDGYISWINNGQLAWTMNAGAVGADEAVQIAARPIPQEPMYIIANLGLSPSFGGLDPSLLTFPATMYIDWIRVYQPANNKNIGCDPTGFPTEAYINQYIDAYTDPNLTTWRGDYGQPFPDNKWLGQC